MPNFTRKSFNPKRALVDPRPSRAELSALAERVGYGGNPEHKRRAGDFSLTPPSAPRPDKTLCDGVGIVARAVALAALRDGVLKGMISRQRRGSYPQNIWSVTAGIALEAQLENLETGIYHGYPLPADDPFCTIILHAWKTR